MRGLLLKDLALMKGQKKFLLLVILIAAVPVLTSGNIGFLTTYLPFVICFFTISTVSYDEIDNSISFLMTLPVSRKDYAKEKYVCGLLLGLGTLVLCQLLGLAAGFFMSDFIAEVYFLQGAAIAGVIVLFLSVILPIQLKFGTEKGRIFTFVVFIAIMGLAVLVSRLTGLSVDSKIIKNILGILAQIPLWGYILGGVLVSLLLLGISYGISVKIMEKKEF